jgi:hypothetical protein
MVNLFLFLFFGFIFSYKALRSDKPDIKLKGKFLVIAFILFTFGSILETFVPLTQITVVIYRCILILSSMSFYIGYILPDWIKKIFLKK